MAEVTQQPQGVLGYVREVRETYSALKWVWDDLVSDIGKRLVLVMLGILSLVMVAAALQPLVFAWMINSLKETPDAQLLVFVGALLLSVGILNHVAGTAHSFVREWAWNRCMHYFQGRINELFYEKSLGQHIDEGSSLNYANIERSKNRIEGIQQMLFFETGSMFLSVILSYGFIWYISVVAGAAATVLLVVHVTWSMYLNYHVTVETSPIERKFRAHNRQMIERWEKIVRVKTSGKAESEHVRLSKWFDNILEEDKKFWFWFIRSSAAREFVGLLMRALVVGWGVYLVYKGSIEIGLLVPLYAWTTDMTNNLWYIGQAERRLNEQVPYIQSLRKTLTMPPRFSEDHGETLTTSVPVPVRFKSVGISYAEQNRAELPILRDVDFAIDPGEKVALLGPSGAGKTTVMKLLLRFMDPTCGEIWVNGHRLSDLKLASWMEHVGYIPQQPQIFDGTIRYNLTFGLSAELQQSITDEEIWRVMRLLQIDFGERLTDGLDTIVGRDGVKLSGGQAQRLMIGAAVIKRPIFMVIDEATSSLDSTTEKLVQEGLHTVLDGPVGALIVAHRLSTVRTICNRFLVLRPLSEVPNGESQIEADATSFEELYKISPTFRRLADDQGISL
ncbi:hypothetical protein A3D62_02425 [Candidatus Kaiserbacteria bacterium RIFCSPHIGHO2_02_FULL_49_11]|uniref:ABC transporter domain-containing protein n=1 Tax=Candidatus Kaiserbacteria bacterium RIFCSPHIGHO2_02_FULL_49_11 TaxID=1798489 RepID=A0A1F6D1T9_9BACT|nr:MAG: hypothetical protein A3D62_02425 [Candidatus Kaiserbacteria bacterium RIFCSPHIGHO2_02_FULL_49_11]